MKSICRTLMVVLFVLGLLPVTTVAQTTSNQALFRYIEQVRQTWRIPGLSVSVVAGDSTVFAEGFGSLRNDAYLPVQAQSLFHIGSVSKSFTAAIIATMVDEGLLKWNDRVADLMPDFVWPDPWVRERMLVRDLMLHSTGLRGQAGTYLPNLGYSRDQIRAMIGRMEPGYTYRGNFEYNNVTFLIISQLIGQLTGKTWEENLQERLLDPLGMKRTVTGQQGYLAAGERASCQHEFLFDAKDTVRTRLLEGDDRALNWLTVVGPAGGICSDAAEMTQWLRLHLNEGEVDGVRVLSKASMRELHKGRTVVSQGDDYIRLYGLCWYVEQNDAYKVIYHTGTTWGHTALCAFVPEMGLGIMILCNSEVSDGARHAIMRRIVDDYRGAPQKDYNRENFVQWADRQFSYLEEDEQQVDGAVPFVRCSNASLVGCYQKDALFGDACIYEDGGQLWIRIGGKSWSRPLEFDPDQGYFFWMDGHCFPVSFEMDQDGKAKTLNVEFNYHEEGFGGWVRCDD